MPVEPVQATARRSTPILPPGQVVGGRFQVQDKVSDDALGTVLRALDQKTKRPIALRVLAPELTSSEAASRALKNECRAASQLAHRSIVGTYGVGSAAGIASFVACEWVDGAPLSRLVAARNERGEKLSLRGAYNVVAHVCSALSKAHETTSHGALRPSIVWVTKSGRVKVGDFGVARAIVTANGAAALGATEQACLAPEVKQGAPPDARSDIFGLGALLYEMLTGKSPADGFVPPSHAHPDASPEIDQVLLKCLAADPAARYPTPEAVRQALAPLVTSAPEVPPEQDFSIDVDVTIPDEADSQAKTMVQPKINAKAGAAPGVPVVGARVSIHDEFRPSAISHPQAHVGAPAPSSAGAGEVDLKDLLAKITENDAPRWMVVKDKLDHGPFSGRELVQMILKGDVLEAHGLLNMDTGERRQVKGFPEFVEFLEQFKVKKAQTEQAAALKRSEKVEKAGTAVKFLIGAGVLAVLGIGAVIFVMTRESDDTEQLADAELADLYERGEIEIEGSAGILPTPRPGRGGRRGGGGGGGGGGGSLSYEDAMNQAVNLGDVSQGGSERQLTPADVAGVMNRNINRLFTCVGAELRRGGSLGEVQIDLAIQGNGQVLGASVRQGSGGFKSCIASQVRGIRFPTFPAQRMGARYRFSVN